MSSTTSDFTFRQDRSGNMILGKSSEYVCNKIKMLFGMIPGYDEYAPYKGLHIAGKRYTAHVDRTRDVAYENEITEQITTYTDFIPVNVVAVYIANSIRVALDIKYENTVYQIDVTVNQDSLDAVLRNQT